MQNGWNQNFLVKSTRILIEITGILIDIILIEIRILVDFSKNIVSIRIFVTSIRILINLTENSDSSIFNQKLFAVYVCRNELQALI